MMSGAKKMVPKRRFKEFLNAGDWELRKLGDVSNIIVGGTPSTKVKVYWEPKEVPWMSSGEINKKRIYSTDNMISEYGLNNSNARWVKANSVLIALAGQGKTRGTVAINDIPLTTNQSIAAMELNKDFDAEFIFQNLNSRYEELRRVSSGDGTRGGLNKEILSNFVVPYSIIDEQVEVGNFFRTIDNLIIRCQCKLDKLEATKKALLQEMFPEEGQDIPKRRFKGFTDAWKQRKLGDIARFSKGNGYSKSDLVPSGSPIILYGRLYTNYETTIKNVDTFVELKDKSVISQGGEVIVPASGETAEDISRASVVENQGIVIGGDLNVIKVKELLHPTFLALAISNGEQQKELSKRAQGKSVVHLHNSDLQEVNLIFPLLHEQKEISILFEKIDNIITLHQRKLDKLKNLKQAYLNEMFV